MQVFDLETTGADFRSPTQGGDRHYVAEVAIVTAVEPRARSRAFIVTQAAEPRGSADWRDQLEKMPSD